MSRIAKKKIFISKDVKIEINKNLISLKGKKGKIFYYFNKLININYKKNYLVFSLKNKKSKKLWKYAGTIRSIINSFIIGVNKKFKKKIKLIGIGYKFIIKKKYLEIFLGYSHSIKYILPNNIDVKLVSNTEIELKSIDKQLLGQVSANLRFLRPPEPYKGKGVRYSNEIILIKESKKK